MYVPKRIIITGGAGFIGSHMSNFLCQHTEVEKIIVLDKLNYCSSLDNLQISFDHTKKGKFSFIKMDINDYDFLLHILLSENIDTVMHFAADTHVDNSFDHLSSNFTINNTHATHVLLEALRHCPQIKRIIFVSTDEVYGETYFHHPATENFPIRPTNPYATTKANSELMCMTYIHCYKLPIIITRGNNVYGPHQYPEKVIPKFILQIMKNKPLSVHGSGENYRSYLYITDAIDAFYKILTKGKISEIYNIGSQNYFSVFDIMTKLKYCLQNNYDVQYEHVKDRIYNDKTYCISSKKIIDLDWKEKTPFDTGIQNTITYYTNKYTNY